MAARGETISVDGITVRGVGLDSETRCTHYATSRDVVAIEFYCCETYFPCYECHEACVDHEADVWPPSAFDRRAVLCGRCGTEIPIGTYLASDASCPACDAAFNPGCYRHAHRYFATTRDHEPQ